MSEFRPQPPVSSESNSVTVAHSPQPSQSGIPTYGSMSYTVANAAPATIERGSGERESSKPLSATAIRVVESVLHARVNEANVRRDSCEDF
jgi:hypothetical protein